MFPNISVVLVILYILSLEKYFTKISVTFIMKFERKKVFHFQKQSPVKKVVHKVFYEKVVHKILSKFTCNVVNKETPTQVYFCEFSQILKKSRTPANGWFRILHSFTSTRSNNGQRTSSWLVTIGTTGIVITVWF